MTWLEWIRSNWLLFLAGQKIEAPWWLGSPLQAGFQRISLAHPSGQESDWGLSISDGSRIHVHSYATGRNVVHRDKHDPAQGLDRAIAHIVEETPYGKLALAVGAAYLFNKLLE